MRRNEIVVPGFLITDPYSVENLATTPRRVAGCPEVLHQGDGIRELLPKRLSIAVTARSGLAYARQQTDAGRIAQGSRAVGACEGNPTLCESVDVGRFCIGMASQMPDPVAQIIDRDKQHVGLIFSLGGENKKEERGIGG
jgi:hypothetical protein